MGEGEREIPADELTIALGLIARRRWASLASISDDGRPLASMVAYVPWNGFRTYILHLSKLSRHTRNLLARPSTSLAVSEPDDGVVDPQTLARISLSGTVEVIGRDTEVYEPAKSAYLARLPAALQLFGFADFVLFRFELEEAHYVGGFARAFRLTREALVRRT